MKKQTFTISKISCGHCVATIQRELQNLDGVAKVTGDPQTKTITIEWQTPASKSQIEDRLAEIGYPTSA